MIIGILANIIAINAQDVTLTLIYLVKISCIHISLHCLRHTSNDHILTEIVQCLTMESLHGLSLLKLHLDKWHHHFIPHCPKKLLEIHRIHFYGMLFGWQHNILHILFDGYERACLDIVKPMVCHQVLNGRSCTWTKLNLIKDDERRCLIRWILARNEFLLSIQFQTCEKHIQVIQIEIEELYYLRIYTAKIYEKIRIIFVFGKLLHDITLSYSSCTLYQKSHFTSPIMLPIKQLLINLPLHKAIVLHLSEIF